MDDQHQQEPTLWKALWEHRWAVLVVLLLTVALAGAYVAIRPPGYVAEAVVVVQDPLASSVFGDSAPSGAVRPERYAATQAQVFRTRIVVERALDRLDDWDLSVEDFREQLTIEGTNMSDVIEVGFTADTPERAQAAVNAIVTAYRQEQVAQAAQRSNEALAELDATIEQLDADVAEVQAQIAEAEAAGAAPDSATVDTLEDLHASYLDRRGLLQQRRDELVVDSQLASSSVALESLAADAEPAGPGPLRVIAIAIVGGLVLGATVAYLLALRRRSVGDRYEPEHVLDAPLLAEIPDFRQERLTTTLPIVESVTSAAAESFRFAAASLDLRANALRAESLLVVSGLVGEGKSTVTANVALALGRHGRRVLVVDADFGSQTVSRLLLGGRLPSAGITEAVHGLVPLREAVHATGVPEAEVFVLPRGHVETTAPTFFGTGGAAEVVDQLRGEFDVILIDAPPLLQVAYTSSLARLADTAVVVVPHDSDTRELEDLADRLRLVSVPIAGYLYNRAPLRAEMVNSRGSMADILGAGRRTGASPDGRGADGASSPASRV